MHYNIKPGVVVKTENAAKPTSQNFKYLKSMLVDKT
jgi:hypothetical protein